MEMDKWERIICIDCDSTRLLYDEDSKVFKCLDCWCYFKWVPDKTRDNGHRKVELVLV